MLVTPKDEGTGPVWTDLGPQRLGAGVRRIGRAPETVELLTLAARLAWVGGGRNLSQKALVGTVITRRLSSWEGHSNQLIHSTVRPSTKHRTPHIQARTRVKPASCPALSHVRLSATPWTVALPGSSIHGIFQARILEWVASSSSRGWYPHLLPWQVGSLPLKPLVTPYI